MSVSNRKQALAKEYIMSHPLDAAFEAARTERDFLWQRRDQAAERLKPLPLALFTFDDLADLMLIADRRAPSEQAAKLQEALDRIERRLAQLGK